MGCKVQGVGCLVGIMAEGREVWFRFQEWKENLGAGPYSDPDPDHNPDPPKREPGSARSV